MLFCLFLWCWWVLVDVFDKVYLSLRWLFYVGELWGVESRFYGVAAVLLVFGLVVLVFLVPMSYSWSEVCSTCGGDGLVFCRGCGGSGVCSACGGDGQILSTPEGWWCVFCEGSGVCRTCGGDGRVSCGTCYGRGSVGYWMYNVFGSFVVMSVLGAFLFLGSFGLSYVSGEFYLSFNEWVYRVENMDFWFNQSFLVWLFAKDRKRWAKWTSGFSAFAAVYLGVFLFWVFSYRNVAGDALAGGFLVSIFVTVLFAWLFYKYYTTEKSRASPL